MTTPNNSYQALTDLYPMVPRGLGSSQCESVRSLICRLAVAHTVSYPTLVRYIIAKRCPSIKPWPTVLPTSWGALLFASPLIQAVADATGISDVKVCNLSSLARVIDFTKCIDALVMRHCPLCIKEDPFPNAWEPLIWSIGPVEACPKHHVRLVSSECGYPCDHWLGRARRCLVPGVCRYCGSVGFQCSGLTARQATKSQIWVAEQIGTLISAASSGEEFDIRVVVDALKQRIGERWGSIGEAQRKCGFNDRYLYDRLNAGRLGLQQILILCGTLQADLLSVLRGDVRERTESPRRVTLSGQWLRKSPGSSVARDKIEDAISENPAATVRQLGERIGVSPSFLLRSFPDITHILHARWLERQHQAKWRRLLRSGRKLREARRHLAKAGLSFTKLNVYEQCGIYLGHDASERELFRRMQVKARAGKYQER
ncbi:AraC-like DNA-binding protein [Paraburkholderia sp. MM5477-R1]